MTIYKYRLRLLLLFVIDYLDTSTNYTYHKVSGHVTPEATVFRAGYSLGLHPGLPARFTSGSLRQVYIRVSPPGLHPPPPAARPRATEPWYYGRPFSPRYSRV